MSYSGGLCSWYAAKRLIDRFGKSRVTLLFADTNFEDADLYRFLDETCADFGLPLTRLADGRTPWDVFFDNRFLGNSRVDLCSRILKRELLHKWVAENCSPKDTIQCVGLSVAERSRYLKFKWRMRAKNWYTMAPAMEDASTKESMMTALESRGVALPELYEEGFAHNNCGGFCVKQGMAGFARLLQKRPEFYDFNEKKEQAFRDFIGKDVAIMTDRSGGKRRPLTLKVFREQIQLGQRCNFGNDQGGCGCALD